MYIPSNNTTYTMPYTNITNVTHFRYELIPATCFRTPEVYKNTQLFGFAGAIGMAILSKITITHLPASNIERKDTVFAISFLSYLIGSGVGIWHTCQSIKVIDS